MLLFKITSHLIHRLGHDRQPVLLGKILIAPDLRQILEIFAALDFPAAETRCLHLVAHRPESAKSRGANVLVVLQAMPLGHQSRLPLVQTRSATLPYHHSVTINCIFFHLYFLFYIINYVNYSR